MASVKARDLRDLIGIRCVALCAAAPVDVHVDVAGHEPTVTELDQVAALARDRSHRGDPSARDDDLAGQDSLRTYDPLAAKAQGYVPRVTWM